jgi:hypothetical protein
LELERKLPLITFLPNAESVHTEINMNVSSTTSALVTTSTVQSDSADAVSIAVLRKALDLQGSVATALIQSLPQPSLATQGNVGTKVNTFA